MMQSFALAIRCYYTAVLSIAAKEYTWQFSYRRQLHEARIKTVTRSPQLGLLFFGIALLLRNFWMWVH